MLWKKSDLGGVRDKNLQKIHEMKLENFRNYCNFWKIIKFLTFFRQLFCKAGNLNFKIQLKNSYFLNLMLLQCAWNGKLFNNYFYKAAFPQNIWKYNEIQFLWKTTCLYMPHKCKQSRPNAYTDDFEQFTTTIYFSQSTTILYSF